MKYKTRKLSPLDIGLPCQVLNCKSPHDDVRILSAYGLNLIECKSCRQKTIDSWEGNNKHSYIPIWWKGVGNRKK